MTNDLILVLQEGNFSRNFWSFHEKQKNNKSLLQNADYGHLMLVTIDGSRKKFSAIKVRFRLTDKQFKTGSLKNQDLAEDFQGVELQARVSIIWLSFSDFHPIIPRTGKFFTKFHRFKTSFYKR